MELAKVLRILSDETRFRILKLLREGERSVSRIVEVSKLTQPTISHHLMKLEEAGLVVKRRYKKWVFYKLNESSLKEFMRELGVRLKL
ncbi:winged helix-turn-helix transcriptional regulator [candidate division WOR-3 bacterium]|nr:winged helix-turn-helix transcriptional regulator [candidate division WOR-3 bacterium]MCK4527050.1 winged helix-turn-helix transcriptional regulator [candidate division WOR-3 bacterium]